jgi:hypothetical protein
MLKKREALYRKVLTGSFAVRGSPGGPLTS